MTKVSVIVPIYNGEKDLPDLIECLRSQTYPADQVEYLLVDNNSGDQSKSLIEAAAQSNQITICLVTENQIQSSYAARNAGIRAASSEIFAFTDGDCRPQPQWLENLIQPFSDSNIGIVVGEILALPGDSLLEKYADKQETLSQKHTLANSFCPYGQTANLAIRKQAFVEVGLFRPYLTTGGDADICWRILRETSYQFKFVENAVVKHRHRSTWKDLQSQWRRYGKSNKYLHELHGIDLMREFKTKEYVYRLSRWLLKELPLTTMKIISGKAELVELFDTPIGLLNGRARIIGQKEAKLSDEARQIERF
ncbi:MULTISPECIES: glycosyltransferase family 2 protein [Okeania]|uniref:Glycosyltransferase n=1 Tax=Okeania hirsuta TaxID=1458930 RepID=A0A3N6RD23_9CYAN|nr:MULTISPECIES: glycosyltransferase [Okeania]NES77206.1 glycosyltransferase [Okeania sp. SIO1H4]NET19264.1 glycosyltransferase [Okeania sp. SIO1H5]NET74881.1 glycosyltransferase [Okeania sp. SIO1F9]NET93463.1 glycosyltransferase [Okeania sp. SIO1H2]RQH36699.1 glycosyltransferase [Okeania hirsuta]